MTIRTRNKLPVTLRSQPVPRSIALGVMELVRRIIRLEGELAALRAELVDIRQPTTFFQCDVSGDRHPLRDMHKVGRQRLCPACFDQERKRHGAPFIGNSA